MKNARIHLIYLAIIGFLAFQYWTKAQALNEAVSSIEQFDKLLISDNVVIEQSNRMVKNAIDKQVQAFQTLSNKSYSEKALNTMLVSAAMERWLEEQKLEFINFCGGVKENDVTKISNRFSTKQSKRFFSDNKIKAIRDSLTHFQDALNNVADSYRLKELQNYFKTLKLLKDNGYWQSLKKKTPADALAQLTTIQNQLGLDKLSFLNHIFNYVGTNDHHWNFFRVAITPKKATIFEGETFKADIYLAEYSSNPGFGVRFIINNREIPMKQGVAHFETKETIVGKKTVKALARIKNPLTGVTTESIGEFEYEVLPKCSRDCK